MRGTVGKLRALGLIVVGLTASCADRPRPFRDYCQQIGRALSEEERVTRVLLFAYADAERRRLKHFDQFRDRYLRSKPQDGPSKVVAAYLDHYPDCCAAVAPWPMRRYDEKADLFGSNRTAEEVFRSYTRHFRWTHDVLISAQGHLNQSNGVSFTEFEQSDCGEVARGSSHG